jgi:copine 1/2/3
MKEEDLQLINISILLQIQDSKYSKFFILFYDHEIGSTQKSVEVTKKEKTISFINYFQKEFKFNKIQDLTFSIFENDLFYGKFEISFSQILSSKGSYYIGKITHPNHLEAILGDIIIVCNDSKTFSPLKDVEKRDEISLEEIHKLYYSEGLDSFLGTLKKTKTIFKPYISFKCEISKLSKRHLLAQSNPYFKIFKKSENGKWINVYKSDVIKSTLNPIYDTITLDLNSFCDEKSDSKILFEVWDSSFLSEYLTGSFTTSLNELLNTKEFNIVNDKYKNENRIKNFGIFVFNEFLMLEEEVVELEESYNIILEEVNLLHSSTRDVLSGEKYQEVETPFSFIDYLSGGLEFNLTFAIDFTKSNVQLDQKSFHSYQEHIDNQYETVMKSIHHHFSPYIKNDKFNAFGFGANLGSFSSEVSHCFPLKNDDSNSMCDGIKDLIENYHLRLKQCQFSGPTCYEQILKNSNEISQKSQGYSILVIIAKGDVFDLEKSVHEIIESSRNPLSILIIGLGDETFDLSKMLDSSKKPHLLNEKNGARDNVQFICLKDFVDETDLMTEKILKKIPKQVVNYFALNEMSPKNKITIKIEK